MKRLFYFAALAAIAALAFNCGRASAAVMTYEQADALLSSLPSTLPGPSGEVLAGGSYGSGPGGDVQWRSQLYSFNDGWTEYSVGVDWNSVYGLSLSFDSLHYAESGECWSYSYDVPPQDISSFAAWDFGQATESATYTGSDGVGFEIPVSENPWAFGAGRDSSYTSSWSASVPEPTSFAFALPFLLAVSRRRRHRSAQSR